MKHRTLIRLFAVLFLLSFYGPLACDSDDDSEPSDNDDEDAGTTADGGGDTDTDTDTDGEETCKDGVCIVSGTFTENTTWTADNQYLLRGGVFIGDDEKKTVLTIEPGTRIYGETSTMGLLVIRRNSQINAVGTADNPIVFTSSKEPGTRERGDWGGLIINGNAKINACAEDTGRDICEGYGEGGTGWFGGTNDSDNSGTVKYVRIEFGGHQLSPDNELNGLALQGVGSGTTLDYIHIHKNKDDAIEFYGGACNFKHVLATGTGDDNLDWTDGWRGKGQYFVGQQYDDEGDQGIEADNNGENNVAEPYANPTLSNLTFIGSPDSDSSDIGILLREGTKVTIHNAIVHGFNDACLNIDHGTTWENADSGDLVINNSIIDCDTNFKSVDDEDENDRDADDVEDWFTSGTGNVVGDPMLEDPFNEDNPGVAPKSGSDAIGGGAAPSDGFFDKVDFMGGVDPDDDWVAAGIASGWITFPEN